MPADDTVDVIVDAAKRAAKVRKRGLRVPALLQGEISESLKERQGATPGAGQK